MDTVYDVLSWICLLGGALFCITGGIGVLRLPDFYSRCHAAGLTDTLGAGLILLGLGIEGGLSLVSVKLLVVGIFLFVTSPTATHALVQAASARSVRAMGYCNLDEYHSQLSEDPEGEP